MIRKLLIVVPVILALTVVSLFMPAQRVTIEGIGTLSFETTVTLTVGQQEAYASPGPQIEYDNTTTASSATGQTSLTFAHTIGGGSNRLLVVGLGGEHNGTLPTVTSVTYNAQDLEQINSAVAATNGYKNLSELWYILEADLPSAGSYNVVITFDGAFSREILGAAISVANAKQQAPEANNTASGLETTTIQASITTLTDGAWIFDNVTDGDGRTLTPDIGQTERWNFVVETAACAGSTKPVASAGATTVGWTAGASSRRLALAVAAFAPPAPAWLNCWAKRVKITIDHNDFAEDVTHFPVLIYLSSASGRDTPKDDVTFVFDEVAGNSKRIAVTKSDGTTPLYVEIEKWDATGEEAWLWVSRSGWTISSTTDTDIYLYYDNSQPDNDTWVGDSGSRTEVWDSYFTGVWHLCEETGGTDAFKDSTSTGAHGTDYGSPTLGADGWVGPCVDFAGTDSSIGVGSSNFGLNGSNYATFEHWVRKVNSVWHDYVFDRWQFCKPYNFKNAGDYFRITYRHGAGAEYIDTPAVSYPANYYIVTTFDDTRTPDVEYFKDGASWGSGDTGYSGGLDASGTGPSAIGAQGDGNGGYWDSLIDEVRISTVVRSDAWIAATWETNQDDLLDFGTEETLTLDISNTPASHDFQTVSESLTYTTGLTKFAVTNNSGRAIDISIQGTDMTGGTTWTLSDSCTPGPDTYGLMAGLEGGDYTIIVRKSSPFNNLVENLADSATQNWGLELWTPTSFSDGVAKSGTVTLTAICT